MIEVRGLTKSYDTFVALRDLTFSVQPGEIIGFLGPNGAGKTTTMKILTCAMPQSAGTVTIDGHDINTASLEVRRRIGYLPESTPLYSDMLVYDYLHHAAELRGVPRRAIPSRIQAACHMTGLTDRVGQVIHTLSKGYKQRVGLAQALIHDPDILILDEPTSGLDPNQIVEIRNLIKQLSVGRTILLSTHNLPEVVATCTRILIIHKGRLVADGTPAALEAREATRERLHVQLRGPSLAAATAALAALPGVDAVTPQPTPAPDLLTLELSGPPNPELRAAVYHLAVASSWELLGLTRLSLDLEGLFRTLTREA